MVVPWEEVVRPSCWVKRFSLKGLFAADIARAFSWQGIRHRDVCQEKEKKEDALRNLTTREREIRKRIEDIVDPHNRNCDPDKSGPKSHNTKESNGTTKGKLHSDTSKKGKKRKAPLR